MYPKRILSIQYSPCIPGGFYLLNVPQNPNPRGLYLYNIPRLYQASICQIFPIYSERFLFIQNSPFIPRGFDDPKHYDIPVSFADPKHYNIYQEVLLIPNIPGGFADPKHYDMGGPYNFKQVFGKVPSLWIIPLSGVLGNGYEWETRAYTQSDLPSNTSLT